MLLYKNCVDNLFIFMSL